METQGFPAAYFFTLISSKPRSKSTRMALVADERLKAR
jgi:hypothetical protein